MLVACQILLLFLSIAAAKPVSEELYELLDHQGVYSLPGNLLEISTRTSVSAPIRAAVKDLFLHSLGRTIFDWNQAIEAIRELECEEDAEVVDRECGGLCSCGRLEKGFPIFLAENGEFSGFFWTNYDWKDNRIKTVSRVTKPMVPFRKKSGVSVLKENVVSFRPSLAVIAENDKSIVSDDVVYPVFIAENGNFIGFIFLNL